MLDEQHVLTAKHCLSLDNVNETIISVAGKFYRIRRVWTFRMGDIAVVRISHKIKLYDKLLRMADAMPPPGKELLLSGIETLPNGQMGSALVNARMFVMSTSECGQLYNTNIWPFEFCAYAFRAGACIGDSGGPLWDPITRRIYGVVSRGGRPCVVSGPTVFTRVSWYEDAITESINSK